MNDTHRISFGAYEREKNVLAMNAEQNFMAFDDALAEWRVFWGEFRDRQVRMFRREREAVLRSKLDSKVK